MAKVDPTIVFGNAMAFYPKGPPRDWQKVVALRRRTEQQGADVGVFPEAPVPFSVMAILFGNTGLQIGVEQQKWEAEKGQIRTLFRFDAGRSAGTGVTLLSVHPVTDIQRILNASNNANYCRWVNLVFARVRDTNPES